MQDSPLAEGTLHSSDCPVGNRVEGPAVDSPLAGDSPLAVGSPLAADTPARTSPTIMNTPGQPSPKVEEPCHALRNASS